MKFAKLMMAAAFVAGMFAAVDAKCESMNQYLIRREREEEKIAREESPEKVRKIWKACCSYAQLHNDAFPDNLAQLVKQGLLSPADLISPLDSTSKPAKSSDAISENNISYIYLGKGLTLKNDRNLPFLFEKRKGNRRTKITKVSGQPIRYYKVCNLSGYCYEIRLDTDFRDFKTRDNESISSMTGFILER